MSPTNGAGRTAIAGFGVAVLGIALLYVRGALFARHWPLMAVQAGAVGLMIWARLTFVYRSFNLGAAPTEGELVTARPCTLLAPSDLCGGDHLRQRSRGEPARVEYFRACVGRGGGLVPADAVGRAVPASEISRYRAYIAKTARVVPGVF